MKLPGQYADTSAWSYHIDEDYYAELVRIRALFDEDWPQPDPTALHEATTFLTREARLIDEGRFNHWLELFSDDCLYWVPVTSGGGEPRTEVSHAFDDRRRLTDRVYWLRTGLAYSQIPATRTRRVISNVTCLSSPRSRGLSDRTSWSTSSGPDSQRCTRAGTPTPWSRPSRAGGSRSSGPTCSTPSSTTRTSLWCSER